MNQICLWCIAAVTGFVSLNTIWRVYAERARFLKEDLNDSDSAFAWRLVIFVIFPLLTLIDLRTTAVCSQLLGGYIKHWSYGLLWYQAVPAGLPSGEFLIPVLFAGTVATTVLTILLLPALFFRPHPFVAMLIGYTAVFVPALNFLVDPLFSLAGMGSSRWQQAMFQGQPAQLLPLYAVHLLLACLYLYLVRSQWIRLWFSGLTRPSASEKLKRLLAANESLDNPKTACHLALLYEHAGLRRQAMHHLQLMKKECPESLYTVFAEAYVYYRKREYKKARRSFLFASDYPTVDGELKGSLLAAAACSAFAEGDIIGALNLSERSLEFDHYSLVARMVKVDVFLRQGKREQAGGELLSAMRMGLTEELEDKIPLDVERIFRSISLTEERRAAKEAIYAVSKG
jgi:tetratricopeptide (TPR) repeat protein